MDETNPRRCLLPSCSKVLPNTKSRGQARKFCDNGGRCKQAYHRREHDPLIGSEARQARRLAGLEKKHYGTLRKHVRRELAWKDLLPPIYRGQPGDTRQDSLANYRPEWKHDQAARKTRAQEDAWKSEEQERARARELRRGNEQPSPLDELVGRATYGYRQRRDALEALGVPVEAELHVVVKYTTMPRQLHDILCGYFDGTTPLEEHLELLRKLDNDLLVAEGQEPVNDWAWEQNSHVVPIYRRREEVLLAEVRDALARIELRQTLQGETLDHIREVVETRAAAEDNPPAEWEQVFPGEA